MKALTIRQPWAQLIISGAKDIENRDWYTNVRGRIAIHSSANLMQSEVLSACGLMAEFIPKFSTRIFSAEAKTYPLGCILGTAELYDVASTSDSHWFCGVYGFLLRDERRLATPIPCKGALGFWDVPAEIEALLR